MPIVHSPIKPPRWAFDKTVLDPEVQDLWRNCVLALPLWDHSAATAEDVSGNNLHGTLGVDVLPASDWVSTEYGLTVRFADGDADDRITIADPALNLLDGFSTFSAAIFFKPNAITGGVLHGLLSKYDLVAGSRSWRLFINGDEISLQISTDGSNNEVKLTTTANLVAGTWYKLIVTFASGMYHCWLNGVDVSPGNFTFTSVFGGDQPLLVAQRSDTQGLDGWITDVRIWNGRELTAAEVKRITENWFEMYNAPVFRLRDSRDYESSGTPAGPWFQVGEVDKGVQTFTITELDGDLLVAGISYDVRLKSKDIIGNISAGSSHVAGTPLEEPEELPPPPPTGTYFAVDGVEYTHLIIENSISIDLSINSRSQARLSIRDIAKALSFKPGQQVVIASEGVRLFGGFISGRRLRLPGSADIERIWELEMTDYSSVADRFLVAQVFVNMYAGDIVRSLITTPTVGEQTLLSESITEGLIEQGILFEKVIFNYQTLSQCLTELANACGMGWWCRPDKKFFFASIGTEPTSFHYTDVAKNFEELVVDEKLEMYRNRQYLRAGVQISDASTVESFQGDGITVSGQLKGKRTFTVKRPVGKQPTITVNGTSKTVGIQDVETGKDWYWNKGSQTLTQDPAATILRSADEAGGPDILEVTYFGMIPTTVRADASDEIEARKAIEGGSGVHEQIRDDPRIEDFRHAIDVAVAELGLYGRVPKEVEVRTKFGYVFQGQSQSIQLSDYGVDEQFIVTQASIVDVSPGLANTVWECHYRAVTGSPRGDPIDFWRRLAEAGRKFTIRENETLNRVVERSDQVRLSDAVDGDESNTLDTWTLDPYSVCLAGTGVVGKSECGQVTNPSI